MLLRADALLLHDLKHELELENEDVQTEPTFSNKKLRNRRLKNLENRYHDECYEKLKTLFEKIKVLKDQP